jgi:hypothetical protein
MSVTDLGDEAVMLGEDCRLRRRRRGVEGKEGVVLI